MKKVVITKLDNKGRGICFVNNKITFVPKTLPFDEVEIVLTKENKKYNEAVVTKFLNKSDKRITPLCPYFNECESCNLMHMSYDDTLKFKKEKVENLLYKYAHMDKKIEVVSGSSHGYRNKITLKVVNRKVGYFKNKSHELVEIKKCFLAKDSINKVMEVINLLNICNGEVVIRSNSNNDILLSIQTKDNVLVEPILKKIEKVVGIVVNNKTIYGNNFFVDSINDLKFKVSYNSFFQVNEEVIKLIIDYIRKILPPVKRVLDLYCGVGTIGIALASDIKELFGVEIIENAISNAIENAKLNKVLNTKYNCSKVENILKELPKNIDLIILDPPRSGLDNATLEFVLNSSIKYILYISCEPLTLARDLKILSSNYNVESIKAFDMFPYTEHVECVCVLCLR